MHNLDQSWECIAELRGHRSWVYGVPITPKGILASISGSEILLWNINTQKIEAILTGHQDTILSLSLSPDGQTIASGSIDKTIRLWNLETGEQISVLAKRKDPIYSVVFSPNGKLLAAGGSNKYKTTEGRKATTIYLWDIDSNELVSNFQGHDLRVNTLTFSPDNRILASGSNDNTIKLWDISSGQELYSMNDQASMVSFLLNEKTLISSGNGGIKIWDLEARKLRQSFSKKNEHIRCFAVHPTGKLLAFEVCEGIEIWNIESETRLVYLDFMWPTSMSFSPDGQFFSSGDARAFAEDEGGLVKVWRVPNFENLEPQSETNDIDSKRREIEQSGYFDVNNIEDARQRITASIIQRQGQHEFRCKLLEAYDSKCPITGCDVESALEAAHIIPYQGVETNHPTNGLPLRSDVHVLFDLHLLSIQPETYKVVIANNLLNTCYSDLGSRKLTLPKNTVVQPSQKALAKHYEAFLQKLSTSSDIALAQGN